MTVEVRPVRADEADRLRELRLRALQHDPSAFAATLAESRSRPAAFWAEWTTSAAAGRRATTVVAVAGERWLGMAAGRLLPEAPGTAWLDALWVDPGVRRRGVALALIEGVAAWSRQRGCATLALSVTENNQAARRLYARAGFAPTGRRRPLPADPARIEIFLARPLAQLRPRKQGSASRS